MTAIEKDIQVLVESVLGEGISVEIKKSKVGDYTSNVAFLLAPKLKKNPVHIAEEIAGKIKPAGLVEKAEAVNGHLNFYLNYSELAMVVLLESRTEGYGKQPKKRKKIILEHTSVNPSGPVHVGRIRNSIIGDSLGKILEYAGYDVEIHYFVNDIGKQIAIIAQGLAEGVEPD
ncbi:MAG: arginine--tRNA ligase, partial [Candidatus Altiarchaeales archaeon IMC4]